MKRLAAALLLLFTGCVLAQTAAAPKAEDLYGKWEEKHKQGSLITEFTATTITLTKVDTSGKPIGESQSFPVRYGVDPASPGGKGFNVTFLDKDGKDGGGITAFLKGPEDMIMIFPGVGGHRMKKVRVDAQQGVPADRPRPAGSDGG